MSVSCAPAVASEIRPVAASALGGSWWPQTPAGGGGGRGTAPGGSARPGRPLAALCCGMEDFFAQPRGSGASPAGRRDLFDQGVGCPYGAAPARPRYARCAPAHALRRAKLAGWRCAPSGGHRRLSWPRLRVRGRSAPAKRRRTVRPCPGCAPAAHYARGRRPAKFSRRVCVKPSGRSPRPIPPPPQGGGDMPVGHSKPQRSKKGHTTKTPAGALLQIAVTIAAMVAPPSAGPLVRPCVFDYLHGSLWPVTLQGLPPCFSVPFPKVISYYK